MKGYGNEVNLTKHPNSGFHSKNQNYCKSWPYLIAKTFNTKHHTTAYSGIGITRDGIGDTNNIYMKRYDEIIPFDTSAIIDTKYKHDLVIIGLGANDLFPKSQGKQPLDSSFSCKAFTKFLTKIHENQPSAVILCVFGSGVTDSWPKGLRFLTR